MIAGLVVSVLLACADGVGLKDVGDEELLRREQAAAAALGTYRLRFSKNERKGDRMTGTQVMELLIRQTPTFAVVAEVKSGPNTGRRFLYNAALKKDELLVQESGILGVVGGVWLNIDNSLTRTDTNHPVTNLGLAPILRHIGNDHDKGKAFGGHSRVDEGFDKGGNWCMRWTAPKGAKGLYCDVSLFCVNPTTFLMAKAQIFDQKGMFEDLAFQVLEKNMTVPDTAFTPEGAGF